ncbi:MAG: MFS transporter, partial [Microbacteriaceae bacterium]
LHNLGSANGIVNVGGFLASFVMVFLIGVILDLVHRAGGQTGSDAASLYTLGAFRWAFAVQFVIIGVGVGFLLTARRKTRRKLSADEGIEVAPLWVALNEAWRRRR